MAILIPTTKRLDTQCYSPFLSDASGALEFLAQKMGEAPHVKLSSLPLARADNRWDKIYRVATTQSPSEYRTMHCPMPKQKSPVGLGRSIMRSDACKTDLQARFQNPGGWGRAHGARGTSGDPSCVDDVMVPIKTGNPCFCAGTLSLSPSLHGQPDGKQDMA